MKSSSYQDITGFCAGVGLTPPLQGSGHHGHTERVQAAPSSSSSGFPNTVYPQPAACGCLVASWQLVVTGKCLYGVLEGMNVGHEQSFAAHRSIFQPC